MRLLLVVLATAAGAATALVLATPGAGQAGTTTLVGEADLSLTKSDSPDPVGEDAALTYTVAVENGGPDPATNVTLSDDLPSQVDPGTASPSTGNCDTQGKKVSCDLGAIAAGASATVTIQVTTKKKAGQITNTASVESDATDPQSANNQDSETTTVSEPATCKKKAVTIPAGTDAAETFNGTPRKDVILAGGGDDQINTGEGKDLICAGDGNDFVLAGGDNDLVKAQAGRDKAKGQAGDDTVRGGRRRDNLKGGSGNDLLAGGKGRDRCKGGSGDDTLRSC